MSNFIDVTTQALLASREILVQEIETKRNSLTESEAISLGDSAIDELFS